MTKLTMRYFLYIFPLFLVFYAVFLISKGKPDAVVKTSAQHGKALIGGAFNLTNSNGAIFSSESLKGKYSLVYFGFTNCPAICPTDLAVINNAYSLLDNKRQVQPVFITIDPARDTPAQLTEYFKRFDAPFIKLTGTKKDIASVLHSYKVYSKEIEDGEDLDASAGYTMDHSAITYLMDKNGEYVTHFNYASDPVDIANKIKQLIN